MLSRCICSCPIRVRSFFCCLFLSGLFILSIQSYTAEAATGTSAYLERQKQRTNKAADVVSKTLIHSQHTGFKASLAAFLATVYHSYRAQSALAQGGEIVVLTGVAYGVYSAGYLDWPIRQLGYVKERVTDWQNDRIREGIKRQLTQHYQSLGKDHLLSMVAEFVDAIPDQDLGVVGIDFLIANIDSKLKAYVELHEYYADVALFSKGEERWLDDFKH